MAGGFESPLIDSEVGTDTNTDKDLLKKRRNNENNACFIHLLFVALTVK